MVGKGYQESIVIDSLLYPLEEGRYTPVEAEPKTDHGGTVSFLQSQKFTPVAGLCDSI